MGHYLSKKVPSHFLWVKPSQIFLWQKPQHYIEEDILYPLRRLCTQEKIFDLFFSINTYFFPAAAACYSLFLYTAYKFPV